MIDGRHVAVLQIYRRTMTYTEQSIANSLHQTPAVHGWLRTIYSNSK